MTDIDEIIGALEAAVGAEHVLTGEHIKDDYTHDEALTATPRAPARGRAPGRHRARSPRSSRWATEHGVPVTARGSGTGPVGRVHPARRTASSCRFERMAEILEIDDDNHVAVVQPGVHARPARRGARSRTASSTRCSPARARASLGGNVATNAGGMRAVRYGVTRHQVLGLDAVLGTGEVLRTGGKFVKATSGYDLTQLIIGSEGTLALVTEATLRLHPRLTHGATMLAPFATLDEVAAVDPADRRLAALRPTILEYIDFITMSAHHASRRPRARHARGDQGRRRSPTSSSCSRTATTTALDEDTGELAELLTELGALDVYVLPPALGRRAHRGPGEGVLEGQGQRRQRHPRHGRAPRRRSRSTWPRCRRSPRPPARSIVGCGHAGDGNVHLVGVPGRPRGAHAGDAATCFAAGIALGGAISGEHGIGTEKKKYLAELEDPTKLALMRRIKTAFDPAGILNPGAIFD